MFDDEYDYCWLVDIGDYARVSDALLDDIKVKGLTTPGHCPSCVIYCIGDYIFTGDSYLPGVKVVTKLPKGNKKQAFESIEKILHLAEDKTKCPGHGEMAK